MPTTYTMIFLEKGFAENFLKNCKASDPQRMEICIGSDSMARIFSLFFFLKKQLTQYGVKMHGEKAKGIFEKGMARVRKEKNPALMAYMLGFGCHYILDSTCHPYETR